jgi:hypothetical protein
VGICGDYGRALACSQLPAGTVTDPMSTTTAPLTSPKTSRAPLLLLAAVFILPLVIGYGLFWSGWRPEKFVNHGELLQPPRPLPDTGLLHADGRHMPTAGLRGKWLLVLPIEGTCAASCQNRLQQMLQVHLALNKEQNRMKRVLISSGISSGSAEASGLAKMQQRFPDLVVSAVSDNAAGTAWHQTLDGFNQAIFVVDPLGNVMMRYSDTADLRGMLKDLERLLKYSWIH